MKIERCEDCKYYLCRSSQKPCDDCVETNSFFTGSISRSNFEFAMYGENHGMLIVKSCSKKEETKVD